MSKLLVLDPTGHTTYVWSEPVAETETESTEAQARAVFDELMATEKFAAVANPDHPDGGTVVTCFDPTAVETILIPRIVGGIAAEADEGSKSPKGDEPEKREPILTPAEPAH